MILTRLRLLFSASCIAAVLSPLGAAELWVSPDGSDRNAGTKESPFASVSFAQRKARELRRLNDPSTEGGVRIVVRGGVYPLTSPLLFRPEDSGTEASPTRVEAAPGERPVLSGGVAVTGWKKLEGDLRGLPEAARGKVWVADAPQFGGRILEFRQLWVGGGKAVRARNTSGGAMERLLGWNRDKREAVISAALLAPHKNLAGLEMFIQQQWEIAIVRVKDIRIEGERAHLTFHEPESQLEFEHPWPQPILPPEGAGAFLLQGTAGFLDEPGEWWQELPSGRVYYWPREGEDMAKVRAVAPALTTLLEVAGSLDRPVAHVQFAGIIFAHSTWMRPSVSGHVPLQAGMHLLDAYKLRPPGVGERKGLENQAWIGRMPAAVTVTAANQIRFERCRFEQLAASGLDLVSGTKENTVIGCVFRDVGGNGIQLGSFQTGGIETHLPYNPADEREISTRDRIANNLLTDCANEDWGCVAILAGYVREVAIEHNEISNVSYTGISLGWGWVKAANAMRDNRVHANRLTEIATRMCDTAGVYTLSAQPGTVISENYVGPIKMTPYVDRPDHWFYYYTDEGSSHLTVRDNWSPAEKFLKNANGPGVVWERNGPMVTEAIQDAAGLEAPFRNLREFTPSPPSSL
ncbi:MAG TPA: right-handed parallel beta-helix repeat-containing protein [Opitutaceae bacterium]|nr:right-handed parallel beta-helix repeat-containing protein [Opitutaceae bacterium]